MPLISVIIPAFNEEMGISETIKNYPQEILRKNGYSTEFIVVDNNSTDNTKAVAEELGMTVIFEGKKGYGYAYKAGLQACTGDIIICADADNSYPLEAIPQYLQFMMENNLDFISGNRFGDGSFTIVAMPIVNRLGNIILSSILRFLYGIPLIDSQSGMWIMKNSVAKNLKINSNGMSFSQELKIEAIFYNQCKWAEIPIEYRNRIGKKKLRNFRDGTINLIALCKKRLVR